VYTAWNFRRQAVVAMLPTMSQDEGLALLNGELKLVWAAMTL